MEGEIVLAMALPCSGLSSRELAVRREVGEQAQAAALLGPGRVCAEDTLYLDSLQPIAGTAGLVEPAIPALTGSYVLAPCYDLAEIYLLHCSLRLLHPPPFLPLQQVSDLRRHLNSPHYSWLLSFARVPPTP